MCVCAKEIYATSEQWSIAFHQFSVLWCHVICKSLHSPLPPYIYSLFLPFVMVTIG